MYNGGREGAVGRAVDTAFTVASERVPSRYRSSVCDAMRLAAGCQKPKANGIHDIHDIYGIHECARFLAARGSSMGAEIVIRFKSIMRWGAEGGEGQRAIRRDTHIRLRKTGCPAAVLLVMVMSSAGPHDV